MKISLVSNPLFLRILAALEPKTVLKKCAAHHTGSMRQVLLMVSGEANLGLKKARIRTCMERWVFKGTHVFEETDTCEVHCQVGLGGGCGNLWASDSMNWQK